MFPIDRCEPKCWTAATVIASIWLFGIYILLKRLRLGGGWGVLGPEEKKVAKFDPTAEGRKGHKK